MKPDNFTYSTLIKGIKPDGNMGQNGYINNQSDLEKAFALFNKLKQNNQTKPDEVLYNCLMDTCVRFQHLDRAVMVFNEMKHQGIK